MHQSQLHNQAGLLTLFQGMFIAGEDSLGVLLCQNNVWATFRMFFLIKTVMLDLSPFLFHFNSNSLLYYTDILIGYE